MYTICDVWQERYLSKCLILCLGLTEIRNWYIMYIRTSLFPLLIKKPPKTFIIQKGCRWCIHKHSFTIVTDGVQYDQIHLIDQTLIYVTKYKYMIFFHWSITKIPLHGYEGLVFEWKRDHYDMPVRCIKGEY